MASFQGEIHYHNTLSFIVQCFDTVRESFPEALEKVVPIMGDISEPGLGIGEENVKLLTDNVAVVFHLAATIKFTAPLR